MLVFGNSRNAGPVLIRFVVAAALLLVAGCEEDDDSSVESPSAPEQHYVYVYSDSSSNVAAFTLDPETGSLDELDGSPYNAAGGGELLHAVPALDALVLELPVAANAQIKRLDWDNGELGAVPNGVRQTNPNTGSVAHLALSPDGKWLIAGDGSYTEIHVSEVDPDSLELTQVPTSPVLTSAPTEFVAVHPSGEFVYAASSSSNTVFSFRLDADTGELIPTSTPEYNYINTFFSISMDPLGEFLLLSDSSANLVAIRIDQGTGNLSADTSINNGNTIYGLRMHPDGETVYAGTDTGLYTYTFNRTTGDFNDLSGTGYYGWEFVDFTFTPNGNFVVIPDQLNGAVMVREVNSDGSLGDAVVDTRYTGDQPLSFLVVDPAAE